MFDPNFTSLFFDYLNWENENKAYEEYKEIMKEENKSNELL